MPSTLVQPRTIPLVSRAVLLFPETIEQSLLLAHRKEFLPRIPNVWQITLGVLRMWHRVLFRFDTIGTSSSHPIRPSLRARIFHTRPLRFPFLVAERAIAPLDFSGLISGRERIIRHLLAAHHDGNQFVYDLELLSLHDGALEELHDRAVRVVAQDSSRTRWLRDLVVYDRYHESLLEAVESALQGEQRLTPEEQNNPDITFSGYLRWCARQPETPEATLAAARQGTFTVADGLALA